MLASSFAAAQMNGVAYRNQCVPSIGALPSSTPPRGLKNIRSTIYSALIVTNGRDLYFPGVGANQIVQAALEDYKHHRKNGNSDSGAVAGRPDPRALPVLHFR